MRRWLRPFLVPLLRRRADEVERTARAFHIAHDSGRALVQRLGAAFLGGFNAMIALDRVEQVVAAGRDVPVHFRPFYYEGTAMGYLPRGYWDRGCNAASAERDLLGMQPDYRYLYYVGLGFWFGFRHGRSPGRLLGLKPRLDPLHFPLCYDGFGFKLGFFDYASDAGVVARLERCPAACRAQAYQGFGRSMFFFYMDDAGGFDALLGSLPAGRRWDLIFGRSLATGFTGADEPDRLIEYVAHARDDEERSARLTGLTWALAAREMNDREYFADCLARGTSANAAFLGDLPRICRHVLDDAQDYADWQARTRDAVTSRFADGRA